MDLGSEALKFQKAFRSGDSLYFWISGSRFEILDSEATETGRRTSVADPMTGVPGQVTGKMVAKSPYQARVKSGLAPNLQSMGGISGV